MAASDDPDGRECSDMTPEPRSDPNFLSANLTLSFSGSQIPVGLTVPGAAVGLREALPAIRSLAEAIVSTAEANEAAAGRKVSCRKGCGACCRQLVPISEVEARQIRDLVESLPEPRRSIIRDRFAEASRRLGSAGLSAILLRAGGMTKEEANSIALTYFALGIACPFLEEESCSIYPDRPIICREYLVTSLPEHCERPSPETVRCVPLPAKVSTALNRTGVGEGGTPGRRVPLSLALEWAGDHPDDLAPRPGPHWVSELLEHLTGQAVPASPPTAL
jgi:Fe-S-cluster containining protein